MSMDISGPPWVVSIPPVSGAVNQTILSGATPASGPSAWTLFKPGDRIAYTLDSGTTATTASVDYGFDGSTSAGQAWTISWASSAGFELGTLLVSPYFVGLAKAAKDAGTFRNYYYRVTPLTGGPLTVIGNV